MNISTSLAALAVTMKHAQLQRDAGLAVLKKGMDTQQAQATQLLELLETGPSFDHGLDLRA